MKVLSGNTTTEQILICSNDNIDAANSVDDVSDNNCCVFVEPDVSDGTWVSLKPTERDEGPRQVLHDELLSGIGDLRKMVGGPQLDLLEICAPWDSPLSRAVRDAGGKALSIGIHNGYDLKLMSGFKKAALLIRRLRPRYVHFSPPCDPWTAMQNCNQRTEVQVENLMRRRHESRKLLKNCRKLLEIQLHELSGNGGLTSDQEGHHHAGGEHPLHAQSWNTPDWRTMARMCGERFTVHGCRHGLCSKTTGELLKKPWGWFSTHSGIRNALELHCNHGAKAHPVIQGVNTSHTAVYPEILCRRFAKALLKDVQQLFPVFGLCENEEGLDHDAFEELPVQRNVEECDQNADVEQNVEEVQNDVENQEVDEIEAEDIDFEIQNMLKKCHRNLGHPGKEAFMKLLRDAGAKPEVLKEAARFSCAECLQRGRRFSTRPSTLPKVTEKWQCLSIDTFWWHTPKEVLQPGEKPYHVLGLSMLDEATDFHCACLVRVGKETRLPNISGEEFRECFSKSWMQNFPAPSLLRYDEEGFMRSAEVKSWLENFGMKLEPIAGESAWQLGKHSRHLHTLKEHMNLLNVELGMSYHPQELLGAAISAKNSFHQVRGYSPNQWAFGQNHSRLSSFLQQFHNLPLQSSREEPTFEKQMEVEVRAQKLFLEVDSRRRLAKSLHAKSRPLREFFIGDLVYYFRRGRREDQRYGGRWYGPARVLAHEKTSSYEDSQHAGSVVWISHGGRLIRCSPEQLRHVAHDLRHLDKQINGPQNFHTLFEQIGQQQKYLDLLSEGCEGIFEQPVPDELKPHFRSHGKQSLPELQRSEPVANTSQPFPDHGEFEDDPSGTHEGEEGDGRERQSARRAEHATGRTGRDGTPCGTSTSRREVQEHLPQHRLQRVGGQSHLGGSSEVPRDELLRGLSQASLGDRDRGGSEDRSEGQRKRRPSESIETFEDRHRQEFQDQGGDRSSTYEDGRMGSTSTSFRRRGGDVAVEQGRSGGVRSGRTTLQDGTDGEPSGTDRGRAPEAESHQRTSTISGAVRSRSPPPSSMRGSRSTERHVNFQDDPCAVSELGSFCGYVGQLEVVEIELCLAPRDVHKQRNVWVVNAKARKGAEVNVRKLCPEEQMEFEEAMKKELDSFLSTEAVQICSSNGVPEDRIMQMRWVHTWKPVLSDAGEQVDRKAKARLIIKGYQDPRLMSLPRESPTLSTLGRNLLLTCAAKGKMRLSSGDIKTAFLQGGNTELQENLYGLPPPEVRRLLNMKDSDILRIAKAIYGLLNAPKKWFESLSSFLLSDGWISHALDQCLFKRIVGDQVVGYLGIHVDDVLVSGVGSEYDASIQRLRDRFPFGAWTNAMEGPFTYCGCEIRQKPDFSIQVSQERFALSLDEVNISLERKNQVDEEVTHLERRAMRQALGGLNWRATQSAPWLLATVSHLQGCIETATVNELCQVNKLIRLQRKRMEHGLFFPALHGECTVVTFTDASWATRKDGSSQGGQLTLLMESNVMRGSKTPFCVLGWTSRRLRRVARSSTSAEAQMTGNALDYHEFSKLAFIDMLLPQKMNLKHPDELLSSFPSCVVCDARNIFDGVVKVETSGLQMEEKRTAIELLAIKERLKQARVELKWVDGEQELADGLTKPWKHEPLIKALDRSEWRIVYDPNFQSARKKRALNHPGIDVHWLHLVYSLES